MKKHIAIFEYRNYRCAGNSSFLFWKNTGTKSDAAFIFV